MKMVPNKKRLDENALKAKCIDFLLSKHKGNYENYVLINELQFADGKRRADVVEVNGSLNVYEIKSDLDTLERLREQIDDYKKCFDAITIVCTSKHIKNVKNIVPKNVGILLVSEKGVKLARKPSNYKSFNKFDLIALIENKFLNDSFKKLGVTGHTNMTITQKRMYISKKLSKKELRKHAISSIKRDYKKQFDQFLKNRGRSTLHDDIQLFWYGSISE